MAERPIIFSGEMVRAILAGRKTQTRRVISSIAGWGPVSEFGRSDTPGYDWQFRDHRERWNEITDTPCISVACPYGVPGDRLWVRETWAIHDCYVIYKADLDDWSHLNGVVRWSPSIHMHRTSSRIVLELAGVRVERVQEISEEDALAEGLTRKWDEAVGPVPAGWNWEGGFDTGKQSYACLWDRINGKKHPWASNPWVWVLEFKRI